LQTIIMPQVGQDIESAEIIEWCKAEGEAVEAGEVVVVVESDKAAFEVEAEESGVLLKILRGEGEEVSILEPIGYIGRPGGRIPQQPGEKITQQAEREAESEAPGRRREAAGSEPGAPPGAGGRILASPAARRVARERGVDLSKVVGTGPGGRIVKEDVLAAAAAGAAGGSSETGAPAKKEGGAGAGEGAAAATREATAAGPGDGVEVFSRMRRRIADRLCESARTVPHFYLSVDVDVTDALAWRKEQNQRRGTRLTVTDMVVRACAGALSEFARMNSHVASDRLLLKAEVNVGVAVATGEGLLVAVIPGADRLTLDRTAEASRRGAEAARRGALREAAECTFTVTSLGMYGVREFFPIIDPPQCGILAVGAAEKRPVALGGEVAVRDMMTLVLGCDHRGVDGAYAAAFLNRIKEHLEGFSEFAAGETSGTCREE